MPIIILEGIDGSGKSTLAHALFNAAPIPTALLHRGPLEGTVEDELIAPLRDVKDDTLMIADRWHVGEMIYGPIYRGGSEVMGDNNAEIERILDEKRAVRIVVAPPLDVVRRRLLVRGEDYLQPEHVNKVYDLYLEFADQFGYKILTEVTDDTVTEILDEALGR